MYYDLSGKIGELTLKGSNLQEFENLLKHNDIQQWMAVRIGFLVYYLMENKDSYFSDLVNQVALKNKNSASELRTLIINYLNENASSSKYTEERSKKIVGELMSIRL